MARRTQGNAPERSSPVVGPIKQQPPPVRNTAVGLPILKLHGGPFDGRETDAGAGLSALFFPDRVHVEEKGVGFGIYRITGPDDAEYVEPD